MPCTFRYVLFSLASFDREMTLFPLAVAAISALARNRKISVAHNQAAEINNGLNDTQDPTQRRNKARVRELKTERVTLPFTAVPTNECLSTIRPAFTNQQLRRQYNPSTSRLLLNDPRFFFAESRQ